jgi:glycosyltransferase involved in cell wall biosynthesis
MPLKIKQIAYAHMIPERLISGSEGINGEIIIIQPTRFDKWKGSPYTIKAIFEIMSERPDLDIRFIHCGVSSMRARSKWQQVLDIYPELDLEKVLEKGNIKFEDYSEEDLLTLMQRADIVLHPTISTGFAGEPYSIAAAQAIMCHKPVILSDSGNLRHFAKNYSRSQMIEPSSWEAIKESLMEWINNGTPKLSEADIKYATTLREKAIEAPEIFYGLKQSESEDVNEVWKRTESKFKY